MARMFPVVPLPSVRADPGAQAEIAVFAALENSLPDDYRVFHRVAWLARRPNGRSRDGEIDFLILHPDHGLLCLEVKGGEILRHGETHEWKSRDRRGKVHGIRNPVDQANEARHALRRRLQDIPGWNDREIAIGHALFFPDVDRVDGILPADLPPEILLLAGDLPAPAARIGEIFRFWAHPDEPRPRPLDGAETALLEQILSPTFTIRPSLELGLREADREILRLTEEQTVVIDLLARNRAVLVGGGAGTGKSCLAVEKARRLAQEGFRTLLTCFNRPLAAHLRAEAGPVEGLTVVNFHQLCYDMAVEAGIPVADPAGATPPPDYFEHELPAALAEALPRRPDLRFDALLVDEAQDFAPGWWPPLHQLLEDPAAGIQYLFHDTNQRIYRKTHDFPATLVPVTLTRNLRNTQAIHRLASAFYTGDTFRAIGPEGRPVEFLTADPGEPAEAALNQVLHRLIDTERLPLTDFAVLSGHRRANSAVGRDGLLGDFPCTEDPHHHPDKVLFQSIHRFKGLERPIIILVELEDRLASDEILYVALTRARGHLIIIANQATQARLTAPDAPSTPTTRSHEKG